MIVLLPHSVVLIFFLTFDGTIFKLWSAKLTCDYTFVTFGGSIFFFLANDDFVVTLSNTNITYDRTFFTFGCTLIFWLCRPHIVHFQHHMRQYFCHIWCSPYFFITFHGSIVTLASTNIILDHIFLTLSGTFETFNSSLFLFSPITIILSKPKKWPKYP